MLFHGHDPLPGDADLEHLHGLGKADLGCVFMQSELGSHDIFYKWPSHLFKYAWLNLPLWCVGPPGHHAVFPSNLEAELPTGLGYGKGFLKDLWQVDFGRCFSASLFID